MTLDEVAEQLPTLRQSLLASFDACALSAYFNMQHEGEFSPAPAARGTILHRVFAECMREMQRQDSETIPVDVALAILDEQLRQANVDDMAVVRVPVSEMPLMEMMVRKWSRDNVWSVKDVLAVERRLQTDITYRDSEGQIRSRTLTGQPDLLLSRPPDEVVIVDYKSGWSTPSDKDEDSDRPGISYDGFFQLAFYAFLIMHTYKTVNAVVLREFYVYRSLARAARVVRADLPNIEKRLSILVQNFDATLASGDPDSFAFDDLRRWRPSPGAHCSYCTKSHLCPIDDDYTDPLHTLEDAERAAAARQVARSVDKHMTTLAKRWADQHGPIPIRHAKKKMVLGYRPDKSGRFEEYVLDRSEWPITIDTVEDETEKQPSD